nr:MAG TPA: tail component [Caudoviricetes sp.]DAS24604.1 MAG TPA: tail component [Caudoviricetes sp.]
MINIKPVIYKELQKVADNVTDTYPDDWENCPVVIFLEEQNKPGEWYDEKERKSNIRYKVDIFDKDSTSSLAVEIDKIFASLGLRRTDCQDVPDPSHLRHKLMRFEGIVDLDSQLVYQYRMEN